MGASVVLACRDLSRAQSALEQMATELAASFPPASTQTQHVEGPASAEANATPAKRTGDDVRDRLHMMLLDLGSFESVRAFARSFKERFDRLDILVNNAGMACISLLIIPFPSKC